MIISLVTENQKKLRQYQELQKLLAPDLFAFVSKISKIAEIQSVIGVEVLRDKMRQVRKTTMLPFIVDDVSLLVGPSAYPGALIKHLLKNNDLVTLPQFLPDNTPVTLVCSIGYFDGFESLVFNGEVNGVTCYEQCSPDISPELDQLVRVNGVPLGELALTENHRGKAFSELAKHIRGVKETREAHNAQVTERWSSRAEEWQSIRENGASYVNHESGYARFDTEVKRVLPLVSGSALDIGCGDGAVTRLVATNANISNILGMDISPEMVSVAIEKTSDSRIRYEPGTFFDTKKQYNLITSRGVILSHMHRSDVVPTLEAMTASLAPNGYLIFDYLSNLANNDVAERMPKNQFERAWISGILSELGLVNISYSGSDTHRVSVLVFHKPMDHSLYFATSNATKVIELQSKCKNRILHLANIDVAEVKHNDIVEIAKDKAKKSYELLRHPVVVTDGGIFINALGGFPGQNSKQAATLLGPKKLLTLLDGEADRTAVRRNCMVYFDGTNFNVCVAEVPLVISDRVTESEFNAYPMDSILIPVHEQNPAGLTYKQMPVEQRVQFTELPIFEKFIATL